MIQFNYSLEGDIESMIARKGMRAEKAIAFQTISRSIKKKLKWLTDRVSVESIDTKKYQRFFTIQRRFHYLLITFLYNITYHNLSNNQASDPLESLAFNIL